MDGLPKQFKLIMHLHTPKAGICTISDFFVQLGTQTERGGTGNGEEQYKIIK